MWEKFWGLVGGVVLVLLGLGLAELSGPFLSDLAPGRVAGTIAVIAVIIGAYAIDRIQRLERVVRTMQRHIDDIQKRR